MGASIVGTNGVASMCHDSTKIFSHKTVRETVLLLVVTFACWYGARAVVPPVCLPVAFSQLDRYAYDLDLAASPRNAGYNLFCGRATQQHGKEQIPSEVRALNKNCIEIRGFMTPIDFKNGRTTKFILCKFDCNSCWAPMPKMNDWIFVRLKAGISAPFVRNVSVRGVLEVGEEFDSDGELASIYRINEGVVSTQANSSLSENLR